MLQESFYTGLVTHTRLIPIKHQFKYNMFWYCLNLDSLELFCKRFKFCSRNRFNFISFYDADYQTLTENENLKDKIKQIILEETGNEFIGTIFILTQLRFLGFAFNPVTFYFCFDQNNNLKYTLTYITNTPWNETKNYVFSKINSNDTKQHCSHQESKFKKEFHISPFNPMQMQYDWRFNLAPGNIEITMDCSQDSNIILNAYMKLSEKPLNFSNAIKLPLAYPFQGIKVISAIYWQAFKLWIKKAPIYDHPKSSKPT